MSALNRKSFVFALLSILYTGCHVVGGWHTTTPPPKPTTDSPSEPISAQPEENVPEPVPLKGITPYFMEAYDGVAAKALEEDRLKDAKKAFDDIARLTKKHDLKVRAQFLGAYLAHRTGDHQRAFKELPELAKSLPLVADVALEMSATSAYRLKKYTIAVELAEKVEAHSLSAAGAALVRCDALRELERWAEAVEAYEDFVTRWPDNSHVPEALFGLVTTLAKSEQEGEIDPENAAAGLEILERMSTQWPGSRWTVRAQKHEAKFLTTLGKEARKKKHEPQVAVDLYRKAVRQMNRKQNNSAEKTYTKVLRKARKGGRLSCKARLEKGIVVSRQRRHREAAELFDETASSCDQGDLVVRALLKGGRSYMAADQMKEAIRLFAAIEDDFPEHSYADDARLYGARCYMALGVEETFNEMIKSLPDKYPGGDMRGEALWTAALQSIKAEDHETAAGFLEKYHENFPVEEGWYTAGRSGYWLGRIKELLGDSEQALALYEHVVATAPLTYYMVLAYSRLRMADPARALALMKSLAPATGSSDEILLDEEMLESYPELAVGAELLRLGLTTRARRQMDLLLNRPETPARVHWIAAALFRQMGQFNDSARATSNSKSDWKKGYPTGEGFAAWTLAYPKAFEEEVQAAGRESAVDPALMWAVMREESGFNTRVESWANAVGLMQLILPTAKAMGKKLGIKVKKKSLKDPETNIRLGAAYLGYLNENFHGHAALIISGYNAGEGAVGKWRKDDPEMELDLFVERIPYKQTRGYTKRVLSSFAAYKFLYENDRPVLFLDMTLP